MPDSSSTKADVRTSSTQSATSRRDRLRLVTNASKPVTPRTKRYGVISQEMSGELPVGSHPGEFRSGYERYATVFVDSCAGDDGNSGRMPSSPLASFAALISRFPSVPPGTVIALRRGCVWNETLLLPYSGTSDLPVIVTAYGSGELPRIVTKKVPRRIEDTSGVIIEGAYLIVESISVQHDQSGLLNGPGICAFTKVGYRNGFELRKGAHHNLIRYTEAMLGSSGFLLNGENPDVTPGRKVTHNTFRNNWSYYNGVMRTLTSPSPGADPYRQIGINQNNDDAGASGFQLYFADHNRFFANLSFGNMGCSLDYRHQSDGVEWEWGWDGGGFELWVSSYNLFQGNHSFEFNFMEIGGTQSRWSHDNILRENLYWAIPFHHPGYNLNANFSVSHLTGAFGGVSGTRLENNRLVQKDHFPWDSR